MRRTAAIAAASLMTTASAFAADLSPSSYGPAVEAAAGGWYLRGDIGYAMPIRSSGEGVLPGGVIRSFENERFGKSMTLGAGVGYKFNSWLRADITAEWRKSANYYATNSGSNYVNGFSAEDARFSTRAFMANGYIDLGSWSGFTPYIGAGVGIGAKDIRNWTTQVVCFTALCAPSAPTLTLPNATKTGFAWALMAGTAIALSDQLALDIGYRFLNLGPAETKTDAFGVSAKLADVKVNEVRVGLRYMFR